MELKHLLYVFMLVYFVFLVVSVDPSYLTADQASHALTGSFFNRFFSDWSDHPTLNPGAVFQYIKAYYVRYPKFVFQYGPVYPLINSFLPHQYLMKLMTCLFAVGTVLMIYQVLKGLFSNEVAFLGAVIAAVSSLFVEFSTVIMPNIPSVFFFTTGLYFYFNRSNGRLYSVMAGLFMGLSVLTKEFAIVYVFSVCLVTLKGFTKQSRHNWAFFIALFLTILPYLVMTVALGGLNVLLNYPVKQAWYGARNADPQFTELSGWTYFWEVIIDNYSLISIPLLFYGAYLCFKDKRELVWMTLLFYLAVTFVSDKAPQRLLYGFVFLSGFMALGIDNLFKALDTTHERLLLLFCVTLMMVLSLPLVSHRVNVPMSDMASDLLIDCPNCTVLVASEFGSVYSSYLMYESFIRDVSAGLRFIRPTSFEAKTALDVINDELVNRVVVIGDLDLIKSNEETRGYASNVEFIVNHYDLLRVYNSDLVGRISVYDTGLNGTKTTPYCFTSIAMGSSFCSDYTSPVQALGL